MADSVVEQLERLKTLKNPELVDLWTKFFKAPPRCALRRQLMIQILEFKIQEAANGGPRPGLAQRVLQAAEDLEAAAAGRKPRTSLKAGTRLVREWKGGVHTVEIGERGPIYKGRRWMSLSQIAREITGTRWSGPRFFGLDRDTTKRKHQL